MQLSYSIWYNKKQINKTVRKGVYMEWSEKFSKGSPPTAEDIKEFVKSPLWTELCEFIESTYSLTPNLEYSVCSGAPGWNVKYKKSGRSLCTLYPDRGYFTCLISIGRKEAPEAELVLTSFTAYLKELYKNTKLFNGSRWLMIEVTSEEILDNVKDLLAIRAQPPKK